MSQSRITSLLNIQYPVIQAAMTWLTSAELVASVSIAGGLGVLGPNAGQTEHAKNASDAAEKMRNEIQKVKAMTDKPFAVNYILPLSGDKKSLEYASTLLNVIIEEKVKIAVVVSYGNESDMTSIKQLKKAGIKILYRDISPTVTKALAAEKIGADALIVTGHEAGGHLSKHQISTLVLLSQVIDAVNIPVIAAGGIYDAKTAKAAFAMGAQGVYMGTRFINTLECPASQSCKEAIIAVNSEELVVISEPLVHVRVIAKRNKHGQFLTTPEDYIGSFRQSMLLGDVDNAFICVSESAGAIHNIISCQELIEEVMAI